MCHFPCQQEKDGEVIRVWDLKRVEGLFLASQGLTGRDEDLRQRQQRLEQQVKEGEGWRVSDILELGDQATTECILYRLEAVVGDNAFR